jgi:diguanylate cyclase (GGDEF)-like protein
MHRENTFLKIITYGPLFFIPTIIVIILIITIKMYHNHYHNNILNIENDLYIQEKKALKTQIDNITQIISYRKSVTEKNLELRVKERVDKAHTSATYIYDHYKKTKSDDEIKDIIKSSLASSVWNNGESFIWIVDYDGMFILAPKYLKHLENTSIIDFQDATGAEIIKEEISIVKEKGGGFIYDTFTKPNGIKNKQYKQIAYVKSFGHYNWYFGSGEYLDTAIKATNTHLIETILHMEQVGKYYVVLMNSVGDILISKSSPDLVGKNLVTQSPSESLTKLGIKLLDTIKTQDSASVLYKIINPRTNKIEDKYSYFSKVPNSDWIIGSGFYLSDIDAKISKQKIDTQELLLSQSMGIIHIALLVIILALLISYYISKKLTESFRHYKNNIESQKNELILLNETLETKVKNRTIELEQIKNNFQRLATTDSLTNIHNRYSIMRIFSLEISRANRYRVPLCAIMLDIDFFKKVNDTYGHDIGDNVLSSLSNLIKKSLRGTDEMGRYGGEEFIILLPNTTLENASEYAERLRTIVSQHIFDSVGTLTISIGLAELIENENKDEFFKRLDVLLYKSKCDGRDKVSF